VREARKFRFLDVDGNWQEIDVPAAGLAFTWCQVPVVYRINDKVEPGLTVLSGNGDKQTLADLALPPELSAELFQRSGRIRQLELNMRASMLFAE
jgi:hypothetical protein